MGCVWGSRPGYPAGQVRGGATGKMKKSRETGREEWRRWKGPKTLSVWTWIFLRVLDTLECSTAISGLRWEGVPASHTADTWGQGCCNLFPSANLKLNSEHWLSHKYESVRGRVGMGEGGSRSASTSVRLSHMYIDLWQSQLGQTDKARIPQFTSNSWAF